MIFQFLEIVGAFSAKPYVEVLVGFFLAGHNSYWKSSIFRLKYSENEFILI